MQEGVAEDFLKVWVVEVGFVLGKICGGREKNPQQVSGEAVKKFSPLLKCPERGDSTEMVALGDGGVQRGRLGCWWCPSCSERRCLQG